MGEAIKLGRKAFYEHSEHQIDLLTLPARFWKWRMHGGAVTLARRFLENDQLPDLLVGYRYAGSDNLSCLNPQSYQQHPCCFIHA